MSDDPFGDLDAAMGTAGDESDERPDAVGATGGEASDDATRESDEPEVEVEDPRERPAFEFDETTHKALYVLESVAAEFDDVITYDVERELIREHGLKNVTKSELHNAALAAVTEHPEFVVGQMLEQRGIDGTEEES